MRDRIDIEGSRHVYFLGIGGIGMSAVARYLNFKALKVSGYHRDENELTKKLEADIFETEEKAGWLSGVDPFDLWNWISR